MSRMNVKVIVAGAAIAAAAVLLAISGAREGWVYFLPVDEFVQTPERHLQRVRLHGKVGAQNMNVDQAMLRADFELFGETRSIRVAYTGVIPEMFQAGSDVVVEGQLADGDVFHADTLMTKCASKYETADGQAPHADPRHQQEKQS